MSNNLSLVAVAEGHSRTRKEWRLYYYKRAQKEWRLWDVRGSREAIDKVARDNFTNPNTALRVIEVDVIETVVTSQDLNRSREGWD